MPKDFFQRWIAAECEGDPDDYMSPRERKEWEKPRPTKNQEPRKWVRPIQLQDRSLQANPQQ